MKPTTIGLPVSPGVKLLQKELLESRVVLSLCAPSCLPNDRDDCTVVVAIHCQSKPSSLCYYKTSKTVFFKEITLIILYKIYY